MFVDKERIDLKTIGLLVSIILTGTMELTVFFGILMSFIPKDQNIMMADVFLRDINSIKPDWKMLIYHAVIGMAILVGCLAVTVFKKHFFQKDIEQNLKLFISSSGAFLLLEIFAVNYILKAPGPWAWYMLVAAFMGSFASKVLFFELSALWHRSLLIKKAIVTGFVALFTLGTLLLAPGSVTGSFIVYVLIIGMLFALMWAMMRLKPWQHIRFHPIILRGADVLVWLSGERMLAQLAFWGMAAFIVSLLVMVDPLAVLAKTAFGEHYYHFDLMLMASCFASSAGNVLGVDHNVFYGLGMPMMIAALSKFFMAQVNYLNVFNIYWWLCIIYFVALFVCLRSWLGSVLLAAGAMFLTIKWQVFYSLSYPVSSIYPNGSTLRCLWDIPIFYLLFLHLMTGRIQYLWLAALGIGGAIVYIPTTGVDLYVALFTYLAGFIMIESVLKQKFRHVGTLAFLTVPAITAFLGFWLICGKAVLHPGFWEDLSYYPHLFTNGFYNIWFWDNLTQGKYLNFSMSIVIPLLYLGTLLWIGIRLFFSLAERKELLTLVICAYGLSLYHHYLTLSLQNNFYMRAVPLVWVIFYWVKLLLLRLASERQRSLWAWAVCIVCAFMLHSNHLYAAFPNFWNTRNVRNPMVDRRTAYGLPEDGRPYFFHQEAWNAETNKLKVNSLGNTDEHIFFEWQVPDHSYLKGLYAQEFDFTEEAKLIASLTKPDEKVALLSSFEVHLLMEAKRRPLFFFFPVVSSRGMYARTFPSTNLHTKTMMNRTIDDLKRNNPTFVFLEKVMLARELPASYPRTHEALLTILDYVKMHYHIYAKGHFLVALQRNQ